MKITGAVIRTTGGPFTIESLTLEDPRPDEVLVRLVGVGICHSDIEAARGTIPPGAPVLLGHEGAGIVERVGADVTHVAPGDHVVLTFPTCGVCASCRNGQVHRCEHLFALAVSGGRTDGSSPVGSATGRVNACFFGQSSFATHALSYARNTVKVSKEAPLALLGQLGCGIQTGAGTVLNSFKPRPGSSLVVFGAGAVGLAAVMAARICECDPIIVVDRIDTRLALARELGATMTINTTHDDAEALINGCGGADYTIEATGNSRVAELAVRVLRPFGSCALVGVPATGTSITLDHAHLGMGRTVLGVLEGDSQPQTFIPTLVELYTQGKLPIDRLVREYRLSDINQAIADASSGATIKPVLRPDAAG